MDSIRKWFYKPKRDDRSLLAQFFYADEALNLVAAELDSFDGRKDPERCTALVNHLRQCQDKVLTICNRIMDDVIPFERADRDFRVKFPDDVMQENLAGQLWFGAECLAAGSSIMNREAESAGMRPLAKAVTKALENVRNQLREQCLRGSVPPESERLIESLKILDRLFAEFELCYVSAMVPVKSSREYELHQLVVVLFSETLHRALEMRLLNQDMVDTYDPALMFTIPRLAIVSGLLVFPDSPLCLDRTPSDMSEMFRPFRTLLLKIRELLWTLSKRELYTLEKLLCSSEEVSTDYVAPGNDSYRAPDLDEFVTRFYTDYPSCEQYVSDFYAPPEEGAPGSWEESGSESDDDTEWAGEASEADTIVAGRSSESGEQTVPSTPLEEGEGRRERRKSSLRLDLDGGEGGERCRKPADADNRNVIQCCSTADADILDEVSELSKPLPSVDIGRLDATVDVNKLEPKELADLIEELMNDNGSFLPLEETTASSEAENIDSSMLAFADLSPANDRPHDLTPSTSSPSSVSDNIEIRTGFLLANQLARTSLDEEATLPVACAESLPDGDPKEAMSAATATLSTLLLSDSPGLSPGSPLDSGLGTVVSCSDGGSLSDRSPDSALPDQDGSSLEPSPPSVGNVGDNSLVTTPVSDFSPTAATEESRRCSQYLGTLEESRLGDGRLDSAAPSRQVKVNRVDTATHARVVGDIPEAIIREQSQTIESNSTNVGEGDVRAVSCTCNREEALQTLSSDVCMCGTSADSDILNHDLGRGRPPRNTRHANAAEDRRNSDNMGVVRVPRSNVGALVNGETVSQYMRKSASRIRDLTRERDVDLEPFDRGGGGGQKNLLRGMRGATDGGKARPRNGRAGRKERDGQTGAVVERRYSGNWDTLVKQHSRAGKTRRLMLHEADTIGTSRLSEPSRRVADPTRRPTARLESESSHSSTCSSCRGSTATESDSGSVSSDTSSFNSDCQDDEEIALAMQAAEIASRNEARSKFRSSDDLVHRLFVCVAGVADQLQTNFAGDLRHILKCVFQINNTAEEEEEEEEEEGEEEEGEHLETLPAEEGDTTTGSDLCRTVDSAEEALGWETPPPPPADPADPQVETPPPWVPDDLAPRCMSCEASFTVVRRRHHCRNCGKVFCARCSSNTVALPRYGHAKPVRVCNRCFMYQVTPFTIDQLAAHS